MLRRTGIVAAGVLAASCLGDGSRAGFDPPDAGLSRFGALSVVVTTRDGAQRVDSEARFLRLAEMDPDSALLVTGQPVWSESLAPGRCVRLATDRLVELALENALPDAQVGLLDAGDLVVNAAGQSERLTPRWMPDLLPFVSGVYYTSDAADGLAPAEGVEVQVSGFGGPDVGRFDLAAALPPTPSLLALSGIETRSDLIVDRTADLDVRWAGPPLRGDETLFVTLRWSSGDALRCRASENGRLRVPARELAAGLRGVDAHELTLAVERVRRLGWKTRGLDAGELVLTARDEVGARLL